MIVREFFAKLGLDVDGKGFARADALMAGIKSGLMALAGIATGAAVGLGALVAKTSATADAFDEASAVTGVNVEALQELTYAAGFSGMGLDELKQSFSLLSRQMASAKDGSQEAAGAFRRLGVSVTGKDGQLRDMDEMLMAISDKLAAMPDGAQKTALAMDLFGRSGAKLIPFLNGGSNGIGKLREEAQRLGVVLDEATVKEGAAFDDAMTQAKGALQGLAHAIAGPLLPALRELIEGFTNWVRANREVIKQRIAKVVEILTAVFKVLGKVLGVFGKALGFVIDNWKLFAILIGSYFAAQAALAAGAFVRLGIVAFVSGMKAAAAWILAAAPVILLAALIAGIILLIDDYNTAMAGGESAIDWGFLSGKDNPNDPWWIKTLKDGVRLAKEIIDWITQLGKGGEIGGEVVVEEMGMLGDAITSVMDTNMTPEQRDKFLAESRQKVEQRRSEKEALLDTAKMFAKDMNMSLKEGGLETQKGRMYFADHQRRLGGAPSIPVGGNVTNNNQRSVTISGMTFQIQNDDPRAVADAVKKVLETELANADAAVQ